MNFSVCLNLHVATTYCIFVYVFVGYLLASIRMNIIFISTVLLQEIFEI